MSQHNGDGADDTAHEQPQKSNSRTPLVDSFGTDLSVRVRDHNTSPIVGRDAEIDRVIQILARRSKRNPVLIGEPGVGKTSIVEGLVQRIISGNVPDQLRRSRVISLDIPLLLAGTKWRGEFEDRVKGVLAEVRRNPDVIIFIDELQMISGWSNRTDDFAHMIKPSLARGELCCIGATDLDSYRRSIESDPALSRRFTPVSVAELSPEGVDLLLKTVHPTYQAFHGIRYSSEVLSAIPALAARFFPRHKSPDRDLNLLDEVGARVAIRRDAHRADELLLQQYERAFRSLTRRVGRHPMHLQARLRAEELLRQYNLVSTRMKARGEDLTTATLTDLHKLVAQISGAPLDRVGAREDQRLLQVEEYLSRTVIGQPEALATIGRALRRSRSGLRNPNHPVGVFLLAGPQSVGKSMIPREVAQFLYGHREALIEVDMANYMDRHAVSQLIGSPPGYHGYSDTGHMTEQVRRHPACIISLNTIELADPSILNLFLQVFEEGHLTDGAGRMVDFRQALIFLTTSVGATSTRTDPFATTPHHRSDATMAAITAAFLPEFLNRLDATIVLQDLNESSLRRILTREIELVAHRLIHRYGLSLAVAPDLCDTVVAKAVASPQRARLIRSQVNDLIAGPVSDFVIRNNRTLPRDATLHISVVDGVTQLQVLTVGGLQQSAPSREEPRRRTDHPEATR